jgi:hypothetical protein
MIDSAMLSFHVHSIDECRDTTALTEKRRRDIRKHTAKDAAATASEAMTRKLDT